MFTEIIASLVFVVALYVASTIWQNKHLPPGPFPLPLLGNLLSIDKDAPYRDLANMTKKYGKIFLIHMGRRKLIVINSFEIAREALVTKAKDFAGRPHHYFGSIFGRDSTDIAFQTFSQRWKAQHKMVMTAMRLTENKANISLHIEELCEKLRSYEETPFYPRDPVFSSLGSCLASMIFGEELQPSERELEALIQALHVFATSLAAANLIDTFPIFKYVPIGIIKKAKQAGEYRDELFERKFQEHVTTFQRDNIRSAMDAMLKELRDNCGNLLTEKHLISR